MPEPNVINFYSVSDEYGEFSNFAAFPIVIKKKRWPTSEHFFQSQKFENPAHREEIRKAKTPMIAARLGRDRKKKLRRDWESVKVVTTMEFSVMPPGALVNLERWPRTPCWR